MGNEKSSESGESGDERGFTLREADDWKSRDGIAGTDFSTFVLSLGTTALFHLGLAPNPDPDGGDRSPKVPNESDRILAHQTIATLEMIAEKTRGNLEPDEQKLLESILYELRTRYVAVPK